jgi:predicted DNA-binding protein
MKRIRTTFTLDEDILAELNQYAEELDTKKSHIVESSLTAFFDYLDLKIAEKRLQDLKNGESETISAADVWNDLDID